MLLLGGLLAGALPAQDASPRLDIIPLRHRLASELIPLLEPLLEPGGTLTGSGDQLIVKASPANLEQIRQALTALDQRQQRLRVSVSQSRIDDSAYDHYGIDIATGGRDAGLTIGQPPGGPGPSSGTGINARIARTQGRDEGGSVQSILTLDGQSAWVNTADERPQPYLNQTFTPYGVVVQEGLGWRSAQSGFFVTPRLRGDEVQIEISSQQQRHAGDNSGGIATSGVDTVVTGRLGEWLPLGGTAQTTAGAQGEIIAHTRRQTHAHTGFWVRVDIEP